MIPEFNLIFTIIKYCTTHVHQKYLRTVIPEKETYMIKKTSKLLYIVPTNLGNMLDNRYK
jgi:hypothetical protein